MPPADSGLDPAVRARLERLAGPAGQRRAQRGDPPTSTAGRSGGDGDAGVPGGVEPGECAVPGSPDALLGRAWRLSERHAWAIALLVLRKWKLGPITVMLATGVVGTAIKLIPEAV